MSPETNIAARKARHRRVFAGTRVMQKAIGLLPQFGKVEAKVQSVSRRLAGSPTTRLFRSYTAIAAAIFVIGAMNPSNAYSQNSSYTPSLDGMEDFYGSENLMLADQDGYIPKINPQTELADRTATNDKLVHEVEPGDTLSTIAEQYGLKTSTIMWENGLNAASTIKPGNKIIIPPVDGVSHIVDKNQDINKIASAYSVSTESILKQNQLSVDATLSPGQELYIPGAKPLPQAEPREGKARIQSNTRIIAGSVKAKTNVGSSKLVAGSDIGSDSSDSPATGKSMIFPTRGTITQYFHPGHYAYDIANTEKPPVWAAMGGTVVKASSGTWGGGYGNHVIIDHGNGLKTLYGHMEYLSVQVGDKVDQGQVIGKMGRTGNVRGRTGIHVHFEVIQNGVKKSPGAYF